MNNGAASNTKWLYDSPINSDVEAKLRRFLFELGNADRILGIQVCAYKDGKVIIDTSAGVLGIDDPRPVQPDSLFNVFSVTKGITAGLVHWLADKGKLKLDDHVANIWPEFGTNGKDQIKVNHVLTHSAGLHNALAGITDNDPDLYCNFDECLKRIAMVAPETEPGTKELYHYLSFGWLCGGIIERASGKKYQEVLEEAFARPLGIEGEFYIGIPTGIKESRLATLTIDAPDFNKFATFIDSQKTSDTARMPSSFTFSMLENLIPSSNTLSFRRAIQPAANAHLSARALARYYATLVDGGVVPTNTNEVVPGIFTKPKDKIHDAILGNGDYNDLIHPRGSFGLGFHRIFATNGSLTGFGHMGLGGATGYGDIKNRFAIGVTLNKCSSGGLTGEIIRLICSELDLPLPNEYAVPSEIPKPVFN
ncbi:beta-lactamase domain-containing protein 2-like protein [Tanacetum coccineum]